MVTCHHWGTQATTVSKLNLSTHVNNSFSYSQLQTQLRKLSHFKLSLVQSSNSVRFSQETFYESFFQKQNSQNTTFVEKFYGFSETPFRVPWIHKDTSCANDSTCIQMFNSRITSDALMHSNVSIQIDSQETRPAFRSSSQEISMSSRHIQLLLQASSLCTNIHDHRKTVPKRIPSHSIHEYHCNVLPIHQSTTKMTLQQLDGPIGAVSPEYSSNDRITNSKLTPKQMLAKKNSPKQNRHNPTKAGSIHYTTSARLFEYAQSQKLSSLTSRK